MNRVCVGKDIADASIFILIANLIATMDISKAIDETGKEIAGQDGAANVFRSAKHDRGHCFATLCEGLNMYTD